MNAIDKFKLKSTLCFKLELLKKNNNKFNVEK